MSSNKPLSPNSENMQQVIGFSIAGEEYALPVASVREVLPPPTLTRVPLAPTYISGVINLRGNVIPVIDVARRLGIGQTHLGEKGRLIAVELAEETIAVMAESVSKVTKIDLDDIAPPPETVSGISSDFLDGVARIGDRFLIFLKVEDVLGSKLSRSAE